MQPNHSPLTNVSIFAGMDSAALVLLGRQVSTMAFAPGAAILREGETGNRLFLILTGAVRVCKGFGTGHEVELARLGEGEFFGEMCILDTLPRSATVLATADTCLVALSSLAFVELYEQMPRQYGLLVLNIARDLSRRLRQLDEIFAALF